MHLFRTFGLIYLRAVRKNVYIVTLKHHQTLTISDLEGGMWRERYQNTHPGKIAACTAKNAAKDNLLC